MRAVLKAVKTGEIDMIKGYSLAIIIVLMLVSTTLTSTASPMNRWSMDSNSFGNEQGQGNNQITQTSNQVTLTLYVLDGGLNGEPLSGVDVTGYDALGNSIGGVTDSQGSIVLNGQPGIWQLTFANEGYQTSNLKYTITKSHVAATYLQRSAQSASYQVPSGTSTYTQGTAQSNQAKEITQPTVPQSQSRSQEPVYLKINVHETSLNGTTLSGVEVTGKDAAGKSFDGITNSNGAVILSGMPGDWQFAFKKQGYETLDLNYSVTETEEVAAYLQKSSQPALQGITQSAPQSQSQVSFTVYVHEGYLNGTVLSGVQVTGHDAVGNGFEGLTDSNGSATLSGLPGAWQFSFAKQGYETLNLSYNVTQNDFGDVYLQSGDQSSQSDLSVVSEVS